MVNVKLMYYVCPIGIENLLEAVAYVSGEDEKEAKKLKKRKGKPKKIQQPKKKGKPVIGAGVAHYAKIFNGVIQMKNSGMDIDFEDFDVVFIDTWNASLHLIGQVREAIGNSSSTKIISQIDWGDDMWWMQYGYPQIFRREIRQADYIGVPHSIMINAVAGIADRRAHLVCMPMDIEELKQFRKLDKVDWAMVFGHKYYKGLYYHPWMALRGLKLSKVYTQATAEDEWGLKALYDQVFKRLEPINFLSLMGQCKIGIESRQMKGTSRIVQEAGAVGLPTVGYEGVESLERIFPDLVSPTRDVIHQRKLIKALLDNPELYEAVRQKGFIQCEWYGYEASKERFLRMLEDPPMQEIKI